MDDLRVLLEQLALIREALTQITEKPLHDVTITEGMGYVYGMIAAKKSGDNAGVSEPRPRQAEAEMNAYDWMGQGLQETGPAESIAGPISPQD